LLFVGEITFTQVKTYKSMKKNQAKLKRELGKRVRHGVVDCELSKRELYKSYDPWSNMVGCCRVTNDF